MKDPYFIIQFIGFLNEKEIYESFLFNLIKYREHELDSLLGDDYHDAMKEFLKTIQPIEFISRSFNWQNTSAGVRFWSNLNGEWKHFLETNQKKVEQKGVIEDYTEELFKFLTKKTAWARYLYNFLAKYPEEKCASNLKKFLQTKQPECYITASFTWDETKEKHIFWWNIHNEWIAEFNKIKETKQKGKQKMKYEATKVFNLADILKRAPCMDQFTQLVVELDEKNYGSTQTFTDEMINDSSVILKNIDWMIEEGFVREKKDVEIYPGDTIRLEMETGYTWYSSKEYHCMLHPTQKDICFFLSDNSGSTLTNKLFSIPITTEELIVSLGVEGLTDISKI